MNGMIFPPIGQRERMQFQTLNSDCSQRTYSRGCTVERSEFILARVPLNADGAEVLDDLSEDERRFVQHNITPAEWRRAEQGVKHGQENVSGGAETEEMPGRGDQPGSCDQGGN